ncbi:MAG TPA: glycoside hydrolase family 31 protein [Bacteroidales bacterium]|nr:glycoside hydrolase family 31 protein [Bacteroidales bacterium]
MKNISFLFILLIATVFCQAQVNQVGKVESYQKALGGITGKGSGYIFDIHAYSDYIFRVRISKNKTFTSLPYALENTEIPAFKTKITELGEIIEISTDEVTAIIKKEPALKITFRNKSGETISQDATDYNYGASFLGDRVSVYKELQDGERFVGMGEALGNLDRRSSGVHLNNTDNYKYSDPRLSMYISVPFYIGIHHNLVYGMFFNNSYKSFFNFGLSTPGYASVTMEGGDADYFFMYGESVEKVIENYTELTGRMQMPPLWSIGYQQSRCSYYPQDQVEWIAETFRRKQIPIDGIVLDADYQQGYQPFRVDKNRFPDMPAMATRLSALNIELTASVYPGVKIDSSYESYHDGLKKDIFVKQADGKVFETEIAPLRCYLPDYTNPKAREWWIGKMKWMKDNGINGYWNDMNEPAIGGSYLPENLLFDFDGRKASSLEAKNVYGFQMARSSHDAALRNGIRPFVLTRSAFAGVQRYAAVWSGDNTASDEGILSGVLLNSTMGLSGIPFVGPDLGGYIGDGNKDLYRRWIQVGIFSPYLRNHKGYLTPANEPWSYGEENEAISKTWIGFRYRLMPYIYSKFYEASQTGMPVARSLCINYSFDDKVYDLTYQYQFLFGDAILVVPVTTQEKNKMVYLPKGEWYNLFNDEKIAGDQEVQINCSDYTIPLYVKASSIIPMQSLVQSTKDKPSDTLLVHVYNGSASNRFVYYEDDGKSFDYEKGGYCKRIIDFNPADKSITIENQDGNFSSHFKKIKLVLHGFPEDIESLSVNGINIPLNPGDEKVLNPLQHLVKIWPDYYTPASESKTAVGQKKVCLPFSTDKLIINW